LCRGESKGVGLRWLGTAGFEISYDGWVVLLDPYLTRAPLRTCVTTPLSPDLRAIRHHISGADAIVCGHTHFDHVLDVPAIARFTGAKVFGSRSASTLCRAAGLPDDRIVDVQSSTGRQETRAEVGPFSLRFVPSAHSPFMAGRVPFPGDIVDCDQVPARMHDYKCGAVFGVIIEVAGRSFFHAGSANVTDDVVPSLREVDVLLLCVAGWPSTPNLPGRILRHTNPGAVVLSHWDNFFLPLSGGAKALPAMQMPRLVDALVAHDSSLAIGTVPLLQTLEL
jgi:L-ascorbate metabolism protein UlaG (beta-lactamase superfamily)